MTCMHACSFGVYERVNNIITSYAFHYHRLLLLHGASVHARGSWALERAAVGRHLTMFQELLHHWCIEAMKSASECTTSFRTEEIRVKGLPTLPASPPASDSQQMDARIIPQGAGKSDFELPAAFQDCFKTKHSPDSAVLSAASLELQNLISRLRRLNARQTMIMSAIALLNEAGRSESLEQRTSISSTVPNCC